MLFDCCRFCIDVGLVNCFVCGIGCSVGCLVWCVFW